MSIAGKTRFEIDSAELRTIGVVIKRWKNVFRIIRLLTCINTSIQKPKNIVKQRLFYIGT